MINFSNQQIRNNLAPAFQPEQGTDYTGRMRDIKETNIAGYEIKPFEYADTEFPREAQEIFDGKEPPRVFIEFFMQKYPSTQKYDFLQGQTVTPNGGVARLFQIGQVCLNEEKNAAYVCANATGSGFHLEVGRKWRKLSLLGPEDMPKPLSPTSIPIPEETFCLCIKNDDLPIIEIPGTKFYDDSDYLFLYRENGRTYTQKKIHFGPTFAIIADKPATAQALREVHNND
ncbi:MAG: hypothetical protein FWF63_00795 [Fibromonadales bacterium]|nr:hypothetical protein [Fibromonadales bacterium]